jgi:hypothetical protein
LLQHVGNNLLENILIDFFDIFLPFFNASRHSDLYFGFCVPQMQCILELIFVWSLPYESETLITSDLGFCIFLQHGSDKYSGSINDMGIKKKLSKVGCCTWNQFIETMK